MVTPLQRPGVNTDKTTMGRHKQVTCGTCLRIMRSDNLKGHMKVHEKREESSKSPQQFYNYNLFKNLNLYQEICEKILNDGPTQEGSATERNHDGERDCTTEKRKYDGDDNQSAPKRKCEEIATDKSVNGDFIIYCAHCNYATKTKYNMRRHMDTHNMRRHMGTKHSHTKVSENQHIPSKGSSVECNDLDEALEVWKIYKLLQRMNNK